MAKKPGKVKPNTDEERDINLKSDEAAFAYEMVAEALENEKTARKELNDLIEERTAKEKEYFELMELTNSMAKRRSEQQKSEQAFLADRNRAADQGTRLFYENLKSQTAQVNTLDEIQTRENNLLNLRQQISQNASGQNEQQKASQLQAIDLALQELSIKRDLNRINGRTAEQLQNEADLERNIITIANGRLKVYEQQDAIIKKIKDSADSMVDSLTGKLSKFSDILEKIPVFGNLLQPMFDKLKDGFEKKLKNASDNFIKSFAKNIQSGKGVMESLTASTVGFKTVLMSLMKFALPVLALGALAVGFSRLHDLEEAAYSFKKELGLAGEDAHALTENIRQVQLASSDLGTTIEDVVGAMKALRGQMSPMEEISNSVANSMIVMEKNLGVAVENSAQAQQTFKNIGGLTTVAAQNATRIAAEMATTAGLSANQIVKDIADASDESSELANYVRGGVKQMTKMAIEARLMGSSLEKSAKVAKTLLEFEQSIQDELELSAILGQDINLGRARELAFLGDTVGAQKEIMNQLSNIKDIGDLTAYEREALVKATGMEVSELQKMQQIERQFPGLAKEKIAAAQNLLKQNEDLSNISEADLDRETERLKKQEEMIGATDKIKNQFSEIALQLSDSLVPLGKVLLGVLEYGILPVLQIIGGAAKFIGDSFRIVGDVLTGNFSQLNSIAGVIKLIVGSMMVYKGIEMAINIIKGIRLGIMATENSLTARRNILESKGLIKLVGQAIFGIIRAFSQIPLGIGIPIGLALAAGVASMASKYMSAGDVSSPAKGKTRVSTKEGGLFELSDNDDLVAAPGIADRIEQISNVGEMLNKAIKQISSVAESVAAKDLSKTMIGSFQLAKSVPTSVGVAKNIAAMSKTVGKVATPIAVGGTMLSAGLRIGEGENVKDVLVNEGGGLAGALTGATAGAAIGSIIPGIGTAIGGVVGGILGSFAGDYFTKNEEVTPTPIAMPVNQIPSTVNLNIPSTTTNPQNNISQNELIAELQGLRNDLNAGKIAVNMDGRKVMSGLKAVDRRELVTAKPRK